jgi:type IX secretion system PorP/SprF family membrane protein
MKKNYFLLIGLLLFSTLVNAQDAHFSQYYTFGQALNPALTANHDGSYRVSLIYRNQWSSFLQKSAFNTPGVSVDLPLLEGQLRGDKFGIGLMFYNDRFGQGTMSTLNTALSLAYHKSLGKNQNHRLSLGAQVAYVQKSIDSDGFVFYDQFDVISHSGSGISSDVLTLDRGMYYFFDYNFGLYWKSSFGKRLKLQAGFAASHISQPTEYFIDQTDKYFLARKYTADLGFEVFFTDKFSFSPDALYQRQGKAQEILAGGSFAYYFNDGFRKNSSVHLGARYRVGDAVSALFQVEVRNIRLGAAYDVNVSNLKTSSKYGGGFELSLAYTGESIRSYKANKSLPARRF